MLFYTQIKREFTHASWRRGQTYFREERVSGVRLAGDQVVGQVQGSGEGAYATEIVMGRGTIRNSKCSCPAHRQYETHCKHVAALAVWIVERGSLLRSGVGRPEQGVAPADDELRFRDAQKAAGDQRLRKLLLAHPFLATSHFVIRRESMSATLQGKELTGHPFSLPVSFEEVAALLEYTFQGTAEENKAAPVEGEAVLFVKGVFTTLSGGRNLAALSVEHAVRYVDPLTESVQINTMVYLTKQADQGVWKTNQGVLIKVPPPNNGMNADAEISLIQKLEKNKVLYQGQEALENLAKLLMSRQRDQIVFDPNVNVVVEKVPLKLTTLSIGKKSEGNERSLQYEFKSQAAKFTSGELEELAKMGRLSNQYVWKGDRIYRFETSLARLHQYATRTGVAAPEAEEAKSDFDDDRERKQNLPVVQPFGKIHDDQQNPLHPLAAYRLSLELGVENFIVDDDWQEFHDWRKTFERKKLPLLPKVKYGFKLRVYQKNGLSWLWSLYHRGLAALLADEMGLGKTHQVLALFSTLYRVKRGKPKLPSLVVAPTSVIAAWIQKLQKYDTGLKWHVFHGSGRVLPKANVDIVLTTYGILHREPALRNREWHIVVLDEAQAIKNAQTISSRAARMVKGRFRIAMTGTPIENHSTDLWSLMEFLLPGYLGSLPRFKRLYGWGRETPPEVQAAAFKRLINPFLLRRTKAKVLKELPEKIEEVVSCEMTAIQKKAYRAILTSTDATQVRENLTGGGKIDYANVLAILTRLKQVCDHPKLAELTASDQKAKLIKKINPFESGKWEALQELVQEAMDSELKVVIFTQYLGMMDLTGEFLRGKNIGFTELRGDTNDRAGRLQEFAENPDCRVFICSLLAGGLGIDLTSANVCIHLDRWWNPAKENQATDRLHRFGQTRGVQVFKLQIPGSVEDRIASILESKVALSGALIEESSAGLKALSRKELLQLLTPEAAPETDDTPEPDSDSSGSAAADSASL